MSSFIIKYLILLNILFESLFVVMLVGFISKALINYDYWESFIMLSFFFFFGKLGIDFVFVCAYQYDRVLFASLMLLEMILTTICNTG